MLRPLLKTGLAVACARTGLATALGRVTGERKRPLILAYHRTVDDFEKAARSSIPAQLVSVRTLERQLDWVGRHYTFVSLDDLAVRLEARESFSRPVAAVTFDDGYADVFENAFPLLHRKGIPFAAFVVTDLVGSSRAPLHDRLYQQLSAGDGRLHVALVDLLRQAGVPATRSASSLFDPQKSLELLLTFVPQARIERILASSAPTVDGLTASYFRPMDWEMLRQLRRAGVVIGSHTRSHSLLTLETESSVRAQLEGSRRALERGLRGPVEHFAYPDGCFDAAAVKAVREAGYRYAYTVCRHLDRETPLLTIPRRVLWERSSLDLMGRFSPSVLSCQANGLFDVFKDCSRNHAPAARPADAPAERSPQTPCAASQAS